MDQKARLGAVSNIGFILYHIRVDGKYHLEDEWAVSSV